MKNMKIYRIILLVLLVVFGASCEDPLDKKPLDLISDVEVWGDEALTRSYFAYLYNSVGFLPGGNSLNDPNPMTAIIAHGGEARNRGNQTGITWTDGRMNESSDGPLAYWKFGLIRNINVAIEKLEDANNIFENDIKNGFLGEAYFLRAYVYFEMAKRYGGMPLIDEVQDIALSFEELQIPRSTEALTYDFIASDCDKAIELLEDVTAVYGRASKWAALALKSRAMLYAGSIGEFGTVHKEGLVGIADANKYWQMAMETSRKLINEGPFSLYDQYPNGGTIEEKVSSLKKIFTDIGNSEIIFVEDFTGLGGRATDWEFFYHPNTENYGSWGAFCQVYFETLDWFDNIDGTSGAIDRNLIGAGKFHKLKDLFGNRDPRLYASIAIQESMYANEPVYFHKGTYVGGVLQTSGVISGIPAKSDNRNGLRSGANGIKGLKEGDVANATGLGDNDWVVFRLGEIYLNYAEAAFALGDPNGDALQHLNAIRRRAGMPDRTELTWDVIKYERKIELIFEHHRFWDLRRWRDAVSVLSDAGNGGSSTFSSIIWNRNGDTGEYEILTRSDKNYPDPDANYRNFLEKHYYLPITLARVQANPALIENPGYEVN